MFYLNKSYGIVYLFFGTIKSTNISFRPVIYLDKKIFQKYRQNEIL